MDCKVLTCVADCVVLYLFGFNTRNVDISWVSLFVFVAAPLVEADKETDEGNYVLWRFEHGVAEGPAEIPKGPLLLPFCFPGLIHLLLCSSSIP